ncbi:MAG TPA: cysteine--tRNA ligase [Candidatus Saccharimonadales bacterium]|nr:cysteine--tRNA ligase [Candidatus Saccharimonadales bacterium]
MKLYNTLTKKTDDMLPLDGKSIRIYSCGPTVYDHSHIGNLGSFIFADTLRRTVAANGVKARHVMNFTDIDDKTIRRAQENYGDLEPMAALIKLTEEYGRIFMADMKAVGNDVTAMTFTKATEHIDQMQGLIRELHEGGFAYVADDGVYFSIKAYKKSGKKYGQLSEVTVSSTSQARISNDEYDKESAHDFALWKKQKPAEPAWDFELAGHDLRGRPGWHIECSVMSSGELGQPFDIHTGGVDLTFPHHENEIAQSTAGHDDPLYAKLFAHNEHLLVDGRKMSKSLGNIYTLKDIQEKGFDPLAFRLLVLQAHYRSQAHFSWENLEAAQNRLQDLRALAALRWQPRKVAHDSGTEALRDIPDELAAILADDLDTPRALAYLSRVSAQLLAVHIEEDMVDHFVAMLQGVDALLGLGLLDVKDITSGQKKLIAEREAARADKDWKRSDEIRDELASQGVGLSDHPHGVIWFPLGPSRPVQK